MSSDPDMLSADMLPDHFDEPIIVPEYTPPGPSEPVPLMYDDTVPTSSIQRVLFVSSGASSLQTYANATTFTIVYAPSCTLEDTLEVMRRKFPVGLDPQLTRFGFAFHNHVDPSVFMNNESWVSDSDLAESATTFSANAQFMFDFLREFRVTHVDFLACKTLQSEKWRKYYQLIQSQTGVIVGASEDDTGNVKYGGDWVMESTMEDIRDVYFSPAIENYTSLLYVALTNSNISTAVNLWYSNNAQALTTYGHISQWNVTGVTGIRAVFYAKTVSDDLSQWDTRNITDMVAVFQQSTFTATGMNLSSWNTSNVVDMNYMFFYTNFTGDISGWDVRKVTDMHQMFQGSTFNGSLAGWQPYKVTNMDYMFKLAGFNNDSLNGWDVSYVQTMAFMFQQSYFNGNIGSWNTKNVTNMTRMFSGATQFNQNLTGWDVGKVTDLTYMFHNTTVFNGDLSGWKPYLATSMEAMFWYAGAFNNDSLNGWDVSNVRIMKLLFQSSKFNGNISSWNTSRVTDMTSMLNNINVTPNNRNLNGWDVRQVTTMDQMFSNSNFNGNISEWKTTSLTNMNYMFYGTLQFNQDISGWDVSKVTNMSNMFQNSAAFNGDLSVWEVPLISAEPGGFRSGATLFTNPKFYPHWGKFRLNPIGSRNLIIAKDSVYTDQGVSDTYPNIVVTSNVNTAVVGNYTVEYNVSAANAGKTHPSYQIRYVEVKVKIDPVLTSRPTALASITYPATIGTVSLTGGSALTAVGGTALEGTFSISSSISNMVFNAGTYTDVSATFFPTNSTSYANVNTSVPSVTVLKATAFLATPPTSAATIFPNKLGAIVATGGSCTLTNGGSDFLAGTFTVHPDLSNSVFAAGTYTDISAVFVPTNTNYYPIATTIPTLTVTQPSIAELTSIGVSAGDLKTAGYTATELKTAGFTPIQQKSAGFSAGQMKNAGYDISALYQIFTTTNEKKSVTKEVVSDLLASTPKTTVPLSTLIGYTFDPLVTSVVAVKVTDVNTPITVSRSELQSGAAAVYAVLDVSSSYIVIPTWYSSIRVMNIGNEKYRIYDSKGTTILYDNLLLGDTRTVDGLTVVVGSVTATFTPPPTINFVLTALNRQFQLSTGSSIPSYNPTLTSDAVITLNTTVPEDVMQNTFFYRTDKDITLDASFVYYYVDSSKWTNKSTVLNPKNGVVTTNMYVSNDGVGKDFLRDLAKQLFGTYLGADLFTNEDSVITDVNAKCDDVATYAVALINSIDKTVGTSTLMKTDLSGAKYLDDQVSISNISRELFNQLMTNAPARFSDTKLQKYNASGEDGFYKLPIFEGDTITFKMTISPSATQTTAVPTGLTSLLSRSYKVVMNVGA